MCQAEHDRIQRHAAIAEETSHTKQDWARQQAQGQVVIGGVFPMDPARLHGSQVLQQAEVMCKPAPPFPGPDQTGRRELRRLTRQIVALSRARRRRAP
jgi:hypothetical protein